MSTTRASRLGTFNLTKLILLAIVLVFIGPPLVSAEQSAGGSADDSSIGIRLEDAHSKSSPRHGNNGGSSAVAGRAPYSYLWIPTSGYSGCEMTMGASWSCAPTADSCEAESATPLRGTGDSIYVGSGIVDTQAVEGVTQRGIRVDNQTGERSDLGIRCALPGTAELAESAPVVITMTLSDFARMPVVPLQAHAGPADGWLPVNMTNVLHTNPEVQELSTELLGTPVAVRATPVSYHWDLGDGNTIDTTNPGEPYPSEAVSATYAQEGWYDVTLTTTFTGQFSVAGGSWQDIDGTIEVTSDPVPLYSKSLESRLVNPDVPVDEDADPWIPERTFETEGPQDPDARHRTI